MCHLSTARSQAATSANTASTSSGLLLGVKEFCASVLYSDVTVTCNGEEFKLHKLMLYSGCPFFKTLFTSKFREGGTSKVDLPDDDPRPLATLFHHLYHFTYDDSKLGDEAEAPFAVRVYAIADKYMVPELCKMAASKMAKTEPFHFGPDLENLRYQEIIREDDSTLWNLLMPMVIENRNWLVDDKDFFPLLLEMPDLNKQLVKGGSKGKESSWEGNAVRGGEESACGLGLGGGRRLDGHTGW